MKRVIVTGGSGFVGANAVRRLLHDGHELHLFVRASHQSWRLDEIAGHVRRHELDVHDREGVRRAVADIKPDWVFHLAAYGAYSTQTGIDRMVETNIRGTAALLDACVDAGVESFVHTGSSSEYGYKDHAAAEDERIEPNSDYAVTKAAATHYCQLMARRRDMHVVTVRLYSIYGPYEEPARLWPTLVVLGLRGRLPPLVNANIARDFVYVDEAVDAMIRVASRTTLPRGSVYNVCSGTQSSLESLVSAARRILDIKEEPAWSTMPPRQWDTSVWTGSALAIERATGWRATIGIEAGLEKMAAWFRENPHMLQLYESRIDHGNNVSRESRAPA